jgi:hypothetical protein
MPVEAAEGAETPQEVLVEPVEEVLAEEIVQG